MSHDTAAATIPHTKIPVSDKDLIEGEALKKALLQALSHSPDRISATCSVPLTPGQERQTAYALIHLLQSLRIESVKLSHLVLQFIVKRGERQQQVRLSAGEDKPSRIIDFVSDGQSLTIAITGKKLVQPTHGEILHIAFAPSPQVGRIMANGSIDFRELDKFPPVSKGETILTVALPETSQEGISFDGIPLIPSPAQEYLLALGENVEQVFITYKGRPAYEVRATTPGVIVTSIRDESIVAVGVSERITMGQIDYSVGNIGSDVICPASLEVGTVHEGFSVKVQGEVRVQSLAGAFIESGKEARVEQMLPGSTLVSGEGIICQSASSSKLTCPEGCVEIQREAIDTQITCADFLMVRGISLLLNTTLLCHRATIRNTRVSGTTRMVLGPGLFKRHKELNADIDRLTTSASEVDEALQKVKGSLLEGLKGLAAEFGENPAIHDIFKAIISILKSHDFRHIPKLLSYLRNDNTVGAVNSVQRSINRFHNLVERAKAIEEKIKATRQSLAPVEEEMDGIAFEMSVTMRPSAAIEIHLGQIGEASFTLEPPMEVSKEHPMRIKGSYTLKEGFTISEKSG